MSSRKINNSFLKEKIVFRLKHLPASGEIKVLDCFHGNGCIWHNVRRNAKCSISVLGIDIQEYSEFSLIGDNLKILPNMNLDEFNVIDVDAYGSPYEQIKIIYNKINKPMLIYYTYILALKGLSQLERGLLDDIGYPDSMVKKCPSLFARDGHGKFLEWLATLGVDHVDFINPKDMKYYGCFILSPKTTPVDPKGLRNAHRP